MKKLLYLLIISSIALCCGCAPSNTGGEDPDEGLTYEDLEGTWDWVQRDKEDDSYQALDIHIVFKGNEYTMKHLDSDEEDVTVKYSIVPRYNDVYAIKCEEEEHGFNIEQFNGTSFKMTFDNLEGYDLEETFGIENILEKIK